MRSYRGVFFALFTARTRRATSGAAFLPLLRFCRFFVGNNYGSARQSFGDASFEDSRAEILSTRRVWTLSQNVCWNIGLYYL